MPRKKFIATQEYPYHVTVRCLNKEWFSLPLDEVWEIFSEYLFFIHHAFGVRIYSFVLMPNHFHLLIGTPNLNLDKAMNYFLRESSRIIGRRAGRINQVFGGPYYWSIIQTPTYFFHAYKYVYRNPIEAELDTRVENYKFSTLRALLGYERTIIPMACDDVLFSDTEGQLNWLNTSYPSPEIRKDIKNALHKSEFRFAKDKRSKPHPLEVTLV